MKKDSLYELNSNPSLVKCLPMSIQHVMSMVVGNVTPVIIISQALGFGVQDQVRLVQAAMLAAAIATLIQVYGFGPVGSKLPMVMGLNFSFVPVIITVGLQFGFEYVLGGILVGGLAIILFGIFVTKIRKYFPPLVTGITVMTIGMSLYPVAIGYMAGGMGNDDYGSIQNWAIAFGTLILVILLSEFGKGYLKVSSILVGLVVGYIVSYFLGMVDLTPVVNEKVFELPRILPYSIKFNFSAVLTLVVMFIVTTIEAIGDISSLTMGGLDREATTEEISTGIIGQGVSAIINAFIGSTPTTTFSQNVGIVSLTKVPNRKMIKLTAGIILLIGLLPKFGAIVTSIPYAVLGGSTLSVFAIITVNGIRLIMEEEFTTRNMTIIGISLAIGMGITQVPDAISTLPEGFQVFIGSSPVIMSTIVAFVLNLILPNKTLEEEQKERESGKI